MSKNVNTQDRDFKALFDKNDRVARKIRAITKGRKEPLTDDQYNKLVSYFADSSKKHNEEIAMFRRANPTLSNDLSNRIAHIGKGGTPYSMMLVVGAGVAAEAALGAMVGSAIFPGIGTVAGAFAGAALFGTGVALALSGEVLLLDYITSPFLDRFSTKNHITKKEQNARLVQAILDGKLVPKVDAIARSMGENVTKELNIARNLKFKSHITEKEQEFYSSFLIKHPELLEQEVKNYNSIMNNAPDIDTTKGKVEFIKYIAGLMKQGDFFSQNNPMNPTKGARGSGKTPIDPDIFQGKNPMKEVVQRGSLGSGRTSTTSTPSSTSSRSSEMGSSTNAPQKIKHRGKVIDLSTPPGTSFFNRLLSGYYR